MESRTCHWRAALGHLGILKHLGWINHTNMSSIFLARDTQDTVCIFWGLLYSLKDTGWQKQDTFFTFHSIRAKSHGSWGQAQLGTLTSTIWTKKGHNQQVPPSPGVCQALDDTNCWQDAPRVREDSFSSLFLNYVNFLCSFLQKLQGRK